MSVDTLTVVPQNSSGIPQFNRALSVGTCSPTTSAAVGNAPLIDLVYDYFSITIFVVAGKFDNSSITSFTLTPSGGSTLTFPVDTFTYNSSANTTQWGSSTSYRNLVAGTTYNMQFFSGSTNVNTEGVTLERRNPKDMNDFYGATRNVPPVSGLFKLSWLKNAVKYQFSTSMTAGKYTAGSPANFTIRGYHVGFSIGSMTSTTIADLINFYNGKLIISVSETFDQASTSYLPTLIIKTTAGTGSTPLGVNSQWYKLQIGSAVFYREDASFGANPNFPYWTSWSWNTGSTQNIVENNTYAIKLTC
tara:strand:+ start:65 stop:976 length:912 start_codon:yes stop_codon:yes gene_type:complete